MANTEGLTQPAMAVRKPSGEVKVFYSLGQMAQGGGFDTAVGFIFFYYSAVLGLSGALVGAALAIGLAFDGGVDPLVGSWSDNLKSRLGRRLPFMIGSIPLVAVSLGLLFSPPSGLSQWGLFAWLTVLAVATRTFASVFNVPYLALAAEMTTDSAERTSLVVYRSVAGITAGLICTALGYVVFFADGGLQRPEGYPGYGWSVAVLLAVAMSLCCLGVWRYAASLPQPEPAIGGLVTRLPGEVVEIFRNRSFRVLFLSAVIMFSAMGLNATLNSHAFVFVWRMRTETIQFIGYAYMAGLLLGVGFAPLLQKLMEKKTLIVLGISLLMANWLVLQGLRVTGLWAPVGDDAILPMMSNSFVAGIGTGLAMVAYPAMMADAADEHELLFGRRREGLYFAGLGFANKAASGIGVMMAGIALDLVRFPKDVGQQVGVILPEDVQVRLVMIWGPAAAVVCTISLVILMAYGISRARHAEIAVALQKVRG